MACSEKETFRNKTDKEEAIFVFYLFVCMSTCLLYSKIVRFLKKITLQNIDKCNKKTERFLYFSFFYFPNFEHCAYNFKQL